MPMLDSYLFFDGTCAEAMRFYQRTLGGTLQPLMTYAQAPQGNQCGGAEATGGDRVMHACLLLDGRMLMASDYPPGQAAQPNGGFALSLLYPTPAEARQAFDRLADGGQVTMPMAETFWAEAFGMLTDRFGTAWMVSGGGKEPAPQ